MSDQRDLRKSPVETPVGDTTSHENKEEIRSMPANRALQLKKAAFLAAYKTCGNISEASRACEIDRSCHYDWLRDPEYAEAFEFAKDEATDDLERVARERAKKGSDLLLIFLLKSLRPKVYRERFEHTGPDGGPITIEHLAPMRRTV